MNFVIITGTSSGIGYETAKKFSSEGYFVIGGARRKHELNGDSGTAGKTLSLDLTDLNSISEFASSAATTLSSSKNGEHHLVLNSGNIPTPSDWKDQSFEEFERTLRTNFNGHLALLKNFQDLDILSVLTSVIIVGSVYAKRASGPVLSYSAAKSASETMMKSLAAELAPQTRVNAVLPGHIDTPMMLPPEDPFTQTILTKIPLGRIGKPQEVAEAIFFLSAKATYITGTSLVIDGGFELS